MFATIRRRPAISAANDRALISAAICIGQWPRAPAKRCNTAGWVA